MKGENEMMLSCNRFAFVPRLCYECKRIIHWADSAYFDEKEAYDQCSEMNRFVKNDPNYLAYVVGPIPLN